MFLRNCMLKYRATTKLHLHLILLQFGKQNKLVGVHGNQLAYVLCSTLDIFLTDTQGRSAKLSLPSTQHLEPCRYENANNLQCFPHFSLSLSLKVAHLTSFLQSHLVIKIYYSRLPITRIAKISKFFERN